MTRHRTKSPTLLRLPLSTWAPLLLVLGFALVAGNQLRVQVVQRQSVLDAAKAVKRLYAVTEIPAKRGEITSADGRVLARSTQRQVMGVSGSRTPSNPTMWARISDITGVSAAELADYSSRGTGGQEWSLQLGPSAVEQFSEIRGDYGANGLWLKSDNTREYPLAEHTATLVGFTKDGKGFAGIEASQEALLRGVEGSIKGMTDRTGSFLPWINPDGRKRPIDGSSIELTIRADLQVAASRALREQCELHKATQGTAIVIDPRTGDILAMATWPTFKPDRSDDAMAKLPRSPQLNPAVALRFEPGSTFKVFTVAYGLDKEIISPNESVYCSGSKNFGGKSMSCAGDHGPKSHGAVTPARCIQVSCNVAAATWSSRIGFDKFTEMIRDLGLLQRVDVGLNGAVKGYYDPNDPSRLRQIANLGFGQALNVTPLGLASAFTVFANAGRRVEPRLIKSINGVEQPLGRSDQVFSTRAASQALKMMEAVVETDDGTGKRLRVPGVRLAGKTGTAQKLGFAAPGRHYVSSFVGFVPANKPEAVVLVMIDDPKQNGYYGGVVAGPVFRELAKAFMKDLRNRSAGLETAFAVR